MSKTKVQTKFKGQNPKSKCQNPNVKQNPNGKVQMTNKGQMTKAKGQRRTGVSGQQSAVSERSFASWRTMRSKADGYRVGECFVRVISGHCTHQQISTHAGGI
jgi:hypothetical protein